MTIKRPSWTLLLAATFLTTPTITFATTPGGPDIGGTQIELSSQIIEMAMSARVDECVGDECTSNKEPYCLFPELEAILTEQPEGIPAGVFPLIWKPADEIHGSDHWDDGAYAKMAGQFTMRFQDEEASRQPYLKLTEIYDMNIVAIPKIREYEAGEYPHGDYVEFPTHQKDARNEEGDVTSVLVLRGKFFSTHPDWNNGERTEWNIPPSSDEPPAHWDDDEYVFQQKHATWPDSLRKEAPVTLDNIEVEGSFDIGLYAHSEGTGEPNWVPKEGKVYVASVDVHCYSDAEAE